jgi:hypothetical protein
MTKQARQDVQNFPLGACEITFDATANGASAPVVLNRTLEDQDTQLITTTEVFKVMVDQLAGAFIAQHISGDQPVLFTCSEVMKESQLPDLSAIWTKHATRDAYAMDPHSKEVMWGTLRIHPVAMGDNTSRDFFGPKVMCIPNVQGNFKNQDLVMVNFEFDFSAEDDENSDLVGKILTIGDYADPDTLESIAIEPLTEALTEGDLAGLKATGTYTIAGTVDLTGEVTFSSDEPTVATVSGSTVEAIGAGSANITCSYLGVDADAPCVVTVT